MDFVADTVMLMCIGSKQKELDCLLQEGTLVLIDVSETKEYDSYELNATTEGQNLFWSKRVKKRGDREKGWWEINIGQLHQKAIDAHEKNGVCFPAIIEQGLFSGNYRTIYLATYKGRMSEIYIALPPPSPPTFVWLALNLLCFTV